MRRLLPIVVAALCCAAAPAAEAAKITIKKSMWGPSEVDGKSQFPTYADLGVGIWQYRLNWYQVAEKRPDSPTDPNDPAYIWPADLEPAVADAAKHNIGVSLAVIGSPEWANGGKDFNHAPDDADDYADFIEAAARKYPQVRHWMIWIEPTKPSNFQPLEADRGRPLRGEQALRGPRTYATLLDRSYARLKQQSPNNKVIGGNTFTVGTVAPLRWVQALKLPNGKRPRMDLWGHNPFSARKPKLDDVPLGSGFADFSDLDQLAKRIDRHFPGRLKIFISEFSLPTDHENFEFNFFVSRRTQANWIRAALRITRTFNRIYTFGYLGLYDQVERPAGDQVEWGLMTLEGERKPGYAAFRDG